MQLHPMLRRPWVRMIGLATTVGLAAAACAKDAPQDTLNPKGPAAQSIDNLIKPVWVVAGIIGLMVLAGVALSIIKFRAKRFPEGDVPEQVHGNPKLEIGWTILPAIILAIIAVPTVSLVFKLASKPADALQINVIGQQWWWEFDYPGLGIVTANEIVFPAGQPVQVNISSRDVIHSFWIPALNGKKDAVPGRTNTLVIEADQPGRYVGQCTEYCGLSHANMKLVGVALSEADWQAWVANQQRQAREPRTPGEQAGLAVFNQRGCGACHQISGVSNPQNVPQVAGAAPNLTHLMTRDVFAGAMFDLKLPNGEVNAPVLGAWLRNSPAMKPMYPPERGMPAQNLTEQEIADLIAYLSSLT